MKTLLTWTVVATISLLGCSPIISADLAPARLHGPTLDVEDAVRIAKDLIRKQSVSVADSYIDSARLEQNQDAKHQKFWIVTWLRNEYVNDIAIKGGQIYVHIYMDGTGEVFRGE